MTLRVHGASAALVPERAYFAFSNPTKSFIRS